MKTPLPRVAILLLASTLALTACSSAAIPGPTSTVPSSSGVPEQLARSFDVTPGDRIFADTFAGDVDVTQGPSGKVDVFVTKVTRNPTADGARSDLANVGVRIAQDEDAIAVTAVRLAALLPSTVANIRIVAPPGMVLDLRSTAGNVTLAGLANAVVNARVGTGTLRFEGSLARGSHRLEVGTGNAVVKLPKDASYAIVASVQTGSLTNDLPLTAVLSSTPTTLSGVVGSAPTADVRVDVGTGSIALAVGPIDLPAPLPTAKAGVSPAAAAELIRTTVTGARPILIPNTIPDAWIADVSVDATSFRAVYRSPDGAKAVSFAIAAANPALPGAETTQAHPSFHGDANSLYQVTDGRVPTSDRILLWVEPGTVSGRAEVPYVLSAAGLTDAEFWQIANGLHPNQL